MVPDGADIAIAAITASELLVGVELADQRRRAARQATVDAILTTFDVIASTSAAPDTTQLCWPTRGVSGGHAGPTTSRSPRLPARRVACSSLPNAHAFDGLPAVQHRVAPHH
ncbi:MAG TPA: VapC toxin family PIN domain ribonuclease [Solirubrobacter sp.]|nr:VapC toxin family PIN domain ribonuclease [Solirubrobacter sp.]